MTKPPLTDDAARIDNSEAREFAAAYELLARLVNLRELKETLDPDARPNARMVYTNGLTVWMLILQRLGRGQSLADVVSQVLTFDRDLLPDNKRVREHTLSENSSGYSQARQRLSLSVIEKFSHLDPMYGERNSSEARQAQEIVSRLPERSIVLADAGFGIFSVAYHSVRHQHDFLFRLSHSRFKALRKRAVQIDEGPTHKSYALNWTPSVKDRQSHPELSQDASIEVVIHEVQLKTNRLYLVSTLEIEADSAATLYSRRYDVEFDIRDLKVTMDAENIRAKSVEMVRKELLTSVVAYNLVAQFRRQAAALTQVKPRRLSFKGVWTSFRYHLLYRQPKSLAEWLIHYKAALRSASRRKLPNRKTPREYPRKAHPRRQKSTKFEKSLRKKARPERDPPSPPD